MPQQLATVKGRLEALLAALEAGKHPGQARLEETLTDGYAIALRLDAECARLEHEGRERQARELSDAARRLARVKRELAALRGLLASLRAEAAEAIVA